MKKKIINIFIICLICTFANITCVFASYADFDEEEAQKKNEEMVKEQENLHNITEVKSSDNYLTNIQVEGYTLIPEFDKQTLEYTIKEDVKDNELNINASKSNEKAEVTGMGKIKLEDNKNEYRIDVTAENGSIRTYIIKLKILEDNKLENEQSEIINNEIENTNIEKQNNNDSKSKNTIIYIIIGVIVCIIVLLVFTPRKNRRKRKH